MKAILILFTARLAALQHLCDNSVTFKECSPVATQVPKYALNEEILIRAHPGAVLDCKQLRTLKSEWRVIYGGRTVRTESNDKNTLLLESFAFNQFGRYEIRYRFYAKSGPRPGIADFTTTAICYIEYEIKRILMSLMWTEISPCSGPFKFEIRVYNPNQRISKLDLTNPLYKVQIIGASANPIDGVYMNESGSLYASFPNLKPICDSKSYTIVMDYPDMAALGTQRTIKQLFLVKFVSTGYVSFKCLHNCGTWPPEKTGYIVINRHAPFVLQAVENPLRRETNWTWSVAMKSIDAIRHKYSKPEILTIIRNSLDSASTYRISAKKGEISSTYTVTTASSVTKGKCTIEPKSARLGTYFVVNCTGFIGMNPLYYEISEFSTDQDDSFKTKFIKSSNDRIFEILPPSNNLIVRVVDSFTDSVEAKVADFELISDQRGTNEILERLITNVKSAIKNKDMENAMELISTLSMAAANNRKLNPELKLKILQLFDGIHEFSDSMIKSGVGTLLTLCQNVDPADSSQDTLFLYAGIVASKMSSRLIDISRSTHRTIRPVNTTWTSQYLLSAIENILKVKDPLLLDENADEYSKVVHTAKVSTGVEHIINSIRHISSALSEGFAKVDDSVSLTIGDVRINAKTTSLSRISGTEEEQFPESKVKFPVGFTQQFTGTYDQVFATEIQLPNLFWWKKDEVNSGDTVIVDVKGFVGDKSITVNRSQLPVAVQLDVDDFEPGEVKGKAVFPPLNSAQLDKDHHLSVHRLYYADPIGFLLINFQGTSVVNKLKVVIEQDRRSGFDAVYRQKPLNRSTVTFRLVRPLKKTSSSVYVSVLPAVDYTTVDYTFKVRHIICKQWVVATLATEYCQVAEETVNGTDSSFTCSCDRFGVFLGHMFTPPNSLHILRDVKLFSRIYDNFYVVAITGLLFIIFIIFLIYFIVRDRRASDSALVTYLEDNDPRDKYAYLVGIQTGRFLTPTTTSNVAFYFHGTQRHSKVHVIKSSKNAVLRPGTEDWFLVFSSVQLGDIKMIKIWHDDTGKFPFWYCSQITIVDLNALTITVFGQSNWVSVHTFNRITSAVTIPGEVRREENSGKLVARNAYLGFRELHRWLRLVVRHPRSRDSAAERLSKTYSMIIIMMLVNMLFFGVQRGPADYPTETMKLQQFIVSLQSLAISMIVIIPITMIFEFSKKEPTGRLLVFSHLERKVSLTLKNVPIGNTVISGVNTVTNKASNVVFPAPLKPLRVKASTEPSYHKKTLIFAWVFSSCLNVFATFVVMLYGLNFGKNKSILWLTTFLCGFANDFIVVQPVKILTFSLIAGLIFKGSTPDRVHIDQVKNVVPVPRTYKGRGEMLEWLCRTRTQPVYKPLDPDYVEASKIRRVALWRKLLATLQLGVPVGFILPILFFVDSLNIYSEFFTTALVAKILSESCNVALTTVTYSDYFATKSDAFEYIVFCVLPSFYKLKWYNGKLYTPGNQTEFNLLGTIGWSILESNILFGVPRIRQQRVNPLTNQTIHSSFQGYFPKSYGYLSPANEDKSEYTMNWNVSPAYLSLYSEWIYSDDPENFISLYGSTGRLYSGGGYIVDFRPTVRKSIGMIAELYMKNWMDNLTRVVILEMNIFTFQTRRYRTVYWSIEILPCGLLSSRFQIDSFRRPDVTIRGIITFAFLVILALTIIPVCYLSYTPVGFTRYVTSPANLIELGISVVGIVFVVSYFYEEVYLIAYEYDSSSVDKFISLQQFVDNESNMLVMCGILCVLISIRISYLIFKFVLYGTIIDNLVTAMAYSLLIIIVVIPFYVIIFYSSLLFCPRCQAQFLAFRSRIHSQEGSHALVLHLLDIFLVLWVVACIVYVAEFYRLKIEFDEIADFIFTRSAQRRSSINSLNLRGGRREEFDRKVYWENDCARSTHLEVKMSCWKRKMKAFDQLCRL